MGIFIISDTHFGVRNNHTYFNIIEDYFENYFIPELKKLYKPGDILIHCGDVFDNRTSINIYVIKMAKKIFKKIAQILPVHIIAGNHDLYTKDLSEYTSLSILEDIDKNIHVYYKHSILEYNGKKIFLFPYQLEHKNIKEAYEFIVNNNIKKNEKFPDYIFTHTDFSNLITNGNIRILDGLNIKDFNATYIFNGHIHHSQDYKNLINVGCPYELTRNDSGNKKRFIYLDTDTNKITNFWNEYSPKYLNVDFNDLENNFENIVSQLESNWITIWYSIKDSNKLNDIYNLLSSKLNNYYEIVFKLKEENLEFEEENEVKILEIEEINLRKLMVEFTKLKGYNTEVYLKMFDKLLPKIIQE